MPYYCFEIDRRASIAARALLTWLWLRERSLPVTSVIPASSRTVRTEEPATSPRPGDGRIITSEAQNFAATSCGMERFLVSTRLIIAFFAARVAFSLASCVSAALHKPTPTRPFLSPMTMAAEKLKRRPPVSYTHLRAHETGRNLVCRLLLEKKK